MPLIFGELALKYSPRRVSDPALPDAAANGQYLLVRATAHRAIGGFASVATELLDDVALARRYKQQGHKIRFRLGRGLVRTRMYNNWDDLRVGWTKNLALLFPNARELARKRMQEFRRMRVFPSGGATVDGVLLFARGACRRLVLAGHDRLLLVLHAAQSGIFLHSRRARSLSVWDHAAVHRRIAFFCRSAARVSQGSRAGNCDLARTCLQHHWSRGARLGIQLQRIQFKVAVQ